MSNIESIQQTLNLTLDAAYMHVFVPVEVLIWIRSVAIVLLIVAHALRHVSATKTEEQTCIQSAAQPAPNVFTPELLQELRVLLSQTTVSEEQPETPQIAETATATRTEERDTEEATTHAESVFLSVSEEERNEVIAAYTQGIPRREICSYACSIGFAATLFLPLLSITHYSRTCVKPQTAEGMEELS